MAEKTEADGGRRRTIVSDPRVLRAIAHPMRNRILGEVYAAGHLRAADVAEVLGIPANQASFHLRQLAKYGLVEPAPELARDGRDRVWKPAHEHGACPSTSATLEQGPGGKAAVAVWQRQAAASAIEAVDRAYASRQEPRRARDDQRRLDPADQGRGQGAERAELVAVQDRWQERTRHRRGPRHCASAAPTT